MNALLRVCLLAILLFSLAGCDLWDDMVDSVTGSDDDKAARAAELAVAETAVAQPAATKAETAKPKAPEQTEVKADQQERKYETRFHHTATGSKDGGKSLVLCPGQKMKFTSCSSGGTAIPFHGYDHGRETYWNMGKEPKGDIVCKKGDKTYRFKADKTFVYGQCK